MAECSRTAHASLRAQLSNQLSDLQRTKQIDDIKVLLALVAYYNLEIQFHTLARNDGICVSCLQVLANICLFPKAYRTFFH